MPAKKKPLPKEPPSVEEFNKAIKYVLMKYKGMPELVASTVMEIDQQFIEKKRLALFTEDSDVMCIADELAGDPPGGAKWVNLEDGVRLAQSGQIILDVDEPIRGYLDELVTVGLYGSDREAVARSMMLRGLENCISLVSVAKNPKYLLSNK